MEQTENRKAASAWRSPWVIGWLGLLVTVVAVNITMVYLAITTNPGLVVDDYYERGQDYEQTLVSKLERDPGWEMSADVPQDIRAGERTPIRFFIVDKAGQPVIPDSVQFFAYRPSDVERDFSVPMEEEGSGRYVAQVSFPLIGIWDTLVAVKDQGEEYTLGKRVNVQRP